jgi:hypothetical protein
MLLAALALLLYEWLPAATSKHNITTFVTTCNKREYYRKQLKPEVVCMRAGLNRAAAVTSCGQHKV